MVPPARMGPLANRRPNLDPAPAQKPSMNKDDAGKKTSTTQRDSSSWGGVTYTVGPTQAVVHELSETKQGTRAMLEWCQRVTRGRVEIKSFRNSWWRDGLAFAAIVAAFRPELLDFDRLRSSADFLHNCTVAFEATQIMGIPLFFDSEDLQAADDKCIITQIGAYFRQLWRQVPVGLQHD